MLPSHFSHKLKMGQIKHLYLIPHIGLERHPLHSIPSCTRELGTEMYFIGFPPSI